MGLALRYHGAQTSRPQTLGDPRPGSRLAHAFPGSLHEQGFLRVPDIGLARRNQVPVVVDLPRQQFRIQP